MNLKLYVIPGSHPCKAVEQALILKNLDFKRVDLLPGVHVAVATLLFGKRTVPALKGDGIRVTGSRAIMRVLDSIEPNPPLLPSDPELRKQVEEAERWGDEVFQPTGRAIIWPAFQRDPQAMASYGEDAKPFIPLKFVMPAVRPVIEFEKRLNKTGDENAAVTIAQLPAMLEKIDAWIDEGVIGGDQPNAADLQIGSTVELLRSIADLEPIFAGTKAAELTRHFPQGVSGVPSGTLPAEWLPA